MHLHHIARTFSGEVGGVPQGTPIVLVRFGGCNLRCNYCDAPEALGGNWGIVGWETIVKDICEISRGLPVPVLITGGEPLLQDTQQLENLIRHLLHKRHRVQIETNGTLPLLPNGQYYGPNFTWILDHKLPGSGEGHSKSIVADILPELPPNTWIKMVCNSIDDIHIAFDFMNSMEGRYPFHAKTLNWAMSATEAFVQPLAQQVRMAWDRLTPFRFALNVQIHKVIGAE